MKKVLFPGLLFLAASSRAGVVINEVAFDQPPGFPDWVELFNPGSSPASVDGWTLDDEDAVDGNEVVLSLSTPVPAGAFLVVYLDADGADETDFSDGSGSLYSGTATTVNLAATEDELALRSPQGLADFVAWVTDGNYDGAVDQAEAVSAGIWQAGAVVSSADGGAGYSLARMSDGSDADIPSDFMTAATPTPGAPNVVSSAEGAAPRDVVINEVSWGGTAASSAHEWIELFNASTRTVSLDGWRLRSADGDMDVRLSGTLPEGGFFLLERTSDAPVGGIAADVVYAGSLSNGGEDLFLLDAASGTVDSARFSRSGWPAGSGAPGFFSMERIAPSADGDLWINWNANDGVTRVGVDAKGAPLNGTPRSVNASYSLLLPSSAGPGGGDGPAGPLSVDPATNPFSPRDPDPARRAVRLLFDAGTADAVKTLRIVDARGELVREFGDADGWAGIPFGTLLWDGRDAQGRLSPSGLYLAYFEAVDPASGARRTGRSTVALGYPK